MNPSSSYDDQDDSDATDASTDNPVEPKFEQPENVELDQESEHEPTDEPIEDSEHAVAPEAPAKATPARKRFSGSPRGIRRGDASGWEVIDAMAGRASVFGFGFAPIAEAIQLASESYLGDGSAWRNDVDDVSANDSGQAEVIRNFFKTSSGIQADSVILVSSADMAIEQVIAIARRRSGSKRYRTIAIVGSDHGRTGLCRTASGNPELHDGFGPMMAGFSHVPSGDLDAVKSAIDDQTACVLISPIDFAAGAAAVDGDYLMGLRSLCDEHDLLLAIDETQIVFGASGESLTLSSIADVEADIVALSAGLFGGMPGGLVLANQRATGNIIIDTDRYPMLSLIALQTLESMNAKDLPKRSVKNASDFAIEVAETVSMFEFVRDVHASGMTIGIETDVESFELVRNAESVGLRVEQAGDLAIRMQLPLAFSDDDQQTLLTLLGEMLEATERSTAELAS